MKYIGLDTETHLIEEATPTPRLVCVSLATEDTSFLYTAEEARKHILGYLLDDQVCLVMHNSSFDLTVILRYYGVDFFIPIWNKLRKGLVICTKLYEKLIQLEDTGNPDSSSLAYCAEKYLNIDIQEEKSDPGGWRLRYKELDGVQIKDYPKEAIEYAMEDAVLCLAVFNRQQEHRKPYKDLYWQMLTDFCLRVMTTYGIPTDQEYIKQKFFECNEIIDKANETLVKYGFKGPKSKKDPTLKKNTKVIKEVIEDLFDGNPPKTDKGNVKTDADTLAGIAGHHEGIDALIDSSKSEKVVSTYLNNWVGKKYIHAQYDVLKTTGRISCFKPNLQQVPRKGEIRGCFVPEQNKYFCAIDYGQLELCALAQVTYNIFKDSKTKLNLLEAINEDKDVHCLTASTLMDISYEDVVNGIKEGDEQCAEFRQLSKALNFGIPGGIGSTTFIKYANNYGVKITPAQSEHAIESFFKTFPEVKEYLSWINANNRTDDGGFIVYQHATDRVRKLNAEGYCAAANSYFQGLAADGAKRALIDCFQACQFNQNSVAYGCMPVMIIHDEIVFSVPIDNASESSKELSRIMINAMKKIMPDVKNIKAEPALMNRWAKDAKSVYDEEGNLILWEPEDE